MRGPSASSVVTVGPVARVSAVVRRGRRRAPAGACGRRETFDLATLDTAAVEALVDGPQTQEDVARDEDVLRRGTVIAPGLPQVPSPFTQDLEDAIRLGRGLRGVLDRRARVRALASGLVRRGAAVPGRTMVTLRGPVGRHVARAVARSGVVSDISLPPVLAPPVPPVAVMAAVPVLGGRRVAAIVLGGIVPPRLARG